MATGALKTDIIYSDIRGDMATNPATDDLLLRTNADSIETSVKNLLQTNYFERPFQPKVGSNIRGLLFELVTPYSADALKSAIIETIDNYEPRCIILDVIVVSDPENNSYAVTITYSLISDDKSRTFNTILARAE